MTSIVCNPPSEPSKIITINVTKRNECHKYGYKDIEYDQDDWASADKYLPSPYDLCFLKTDKKPLHGWHTGSHWDGLNVKRTDKIISWKRINE